MPLSDKELMDYLVDRGYVECTDSGNEDPRRFSFVRSVEAHDLREALSRHIRGEKRVSVFDRDRLIPLKDVPVSGETDR